MGSGGQGELWLEGVRWVSGYTNTFHLDPKTISACRTVPDSRLRIPVRISETHRSSNCYNILERGRAHVPGRHHFCRCYSNTLSHQTEPVAQHGHLSLSCHHHLLPGPAFTLPVIPARTLFWPSTMILLLTGYLPKLPQFYLPYFFPSLSTLFLRGKPPPPANVVQFWQGLPWPCCISQPLSCCQTLHGWRSL